MTSYSCPICGSAETATLEHGLYDDRYGFPGSFTLRHCSQCSHRFLATRFADEELAALYTRYYPRAKFDLDAWQPPRTESAPGRWWRRSGSAVFHWVPRNVRVLDVGCGLGESLAYHRARGCEAEGIEADENVRRIADRFGLAIRVGLFHAEDYPRDRFDYVTLDQVIEHAADPIRLLRDVAAVLRPGGTLLLSTPNAGSLLARLLGRRWVHRHTPYHLQLFSRRSLEAAASAAGFRVNWIRHVTHPRWYGFQWLHLLSRPSPGIASLFWSGEGRWPRHRWWMRKTASAAGRIGMNHAIALILDGFRQGDNLVGSFTRTHG